MGEGLLVKIWVAHFLDPDRFWTPSEPLAFVSIFSAIAGLGFDGVVVRDLGRNPPGKVEILGTGIVMIFLNGLAIFISLLVAFRLVHPIDSRRQWMVVSLLQ